MRLWKARRGKMMVWERRMWLPETRELVHIKIGVKFGRVREIYVLEPAVGYVTVSDWSLCEELPMGAKYAPLGRATRSDR